MCKNPPLFLGEPYDVRNEGVGPQAGDGADVRREPRPNVGEGAHAMPPTPPRRYGASRSSTSGSM
jgi:hypothetical protein